MLDRERLEKDNEDLRAEIEALREALYGGPDLALPPEWRLTRQEKRLFGVLLVRPLATRDAILTALYGHPADWGCPKIVDVLMSKMRAKLKAFDVPIETVWGRGYKLDDAYAERLGFPRAAPGDDRARRQAAAMLMMGRISPAEHQRRVERAESAAA